MLNSQFCKIFDIPFFQFAQMKKYCPEDIPIIKATYKENWEEWKALSLDVYRKLGMPFAFFPIKKTARKRSSFSSDLPISGWCKQTRHLLHLLPTNRRRNRPSRLLQSRFASLLGDSHPI